MYSNNLVCQILEYIDKYINTKIEIKDLEYRFYYNRYYIMKIFKKELKITIFDYINKLRIYNSINELKENNKLLIRVALNNGFYSLEYYSEIFKREISVSPKQYQKIINGNRLYNDVVINNITKNLIEIKKLIDKKEKYLQNRKRDVLPIKKLSIFK